MEEKGMIIVTIVFVLALLTILGMTVNRISTSELSISRNDGMYKTGYYLAEGGLLREAMEVGSNRYLTGDITITHLIASQASPGLPPPSPHRVMGKSYDFTIKYLGSFPALKGFSTTGVCRYDYEICTRVKGLWVKARYGKPCPRP